MELNIKQTIAVLVVVILAVSCLIPVVNEFSQEQDIDRYGGPIGKYVTDDLDGWTLDVRKASTGYRIDSSMYTGTMTRTGMILSTDGVTIWTDVNHIYTMIGGTVTVRTELSAIIEGGVLTVNDETVPVTGTIYVLSDLGEYGTYSGNAHSQPVSGIGTYASVTISSIADELTGNSSDYVLDVSVTEEGDRYGIEYVPGEVDVPEIDPFLPDIEHEEDPEPEPVEPGEFVSSGTTGACTWELDGTTLYVRGNGAMGSYSTTSGNLAPWGTGVESVILEEGVTGFGLSCFNGCRNLSYVSLPSTLVTIGGSAFINCKALTHIDIPEGVVSIGVQAFMGSGLKTLILPSTLRTLEQNVIRGCADLTHLYIPPTTTTTATQYGYHFIRLDGYDMGEVPTGDLYLGTKPYVMYQTKTVEIDGAVYRINYIGAELETAPNTENVYIPYTVEYNGNDYTVESIAHGAVSGSSVRYVVIPQTVESVSPTAITGSKVAEVLNLSAVDVTTSHGEVRTSVPALAVISDHVTRDWYGQTINLLYVVPLILVAGAVLAIVRGFARARYD